MEQNKKQKWTKNMIIFLILLLFFVVVCVYSYFFFVELDIPHDGFLSVDVLKKIGLYDNDYHKYDGYWYSNGHLHPIYVASTTLFRKNYITDCIFALAVLIYAGLDNRRNGDITFTPFIIFSAIGCSVIDLIGFCFALYYAVASSFTFPALQTFIIYLLKIIFYISFIIFGLKNKKEKWEYE